MRAALLTLTMVVGGLLAADRSAAAQVFQHYPFCIYTGGMDGGFERCMYTNFQQCLYDRQAEGGICYSNPSYGPAYAPLVEQPRRRPRPRQG
jgi:hypothetical protein